MHEMSLWLCARYLSGLLLVSSSLAACSAASGAGQGTSPTPTTTSSASPPPPAVASSPPAPPAATLSYCDSLQPYLTRAGQNGRLQVPLTCFDLPGITEVGFYGTRDFPTDNRLERCYSSAQKAADELRSDSAPFSFGYSHTWKRTFDAGGGLDLGFLGKWGPKLTGAGGSGQSADVTVTYENVRFRRISDLRSSLETCEARTAATRCLDALSKDGIVYSPIALVGQMVVTVKTGANVSISGNLAVTQALTFDVTHKDDNAGTLTLKSTGDVTIAGTLRESKEIIPPGAACP